MLHHVLTEKWCQLPEEQLHIDLDIDEGEVKIDNGESSTPSRPQMTTLDSAANLNMKQPAADKATDTHCISDAH
jgi:hypothetical protein